MKRCQNCGKEVESSAKFCTYCGKALEEGAAQTAVPLESKKEYGSYNPVDESVYSANRQIPDQVYTENTYSQRKSRMGVVPLIFVALVLIVLGMDYFGYVNCIPRDFGGCLGVDIDKLQKKYHMSAYVVEGIGEESGIYVRAGIMVYDTDDNGTVDAITLGDIEDEKAFFSVKNYKINGLGYGMTNEEVEEVLYNEYSDLEHYGKYYYSTDSNIAYKITYSNGTTSEVTVGVLQ